MHKLEVFLFQAPHRNKIYYYVLLLYHKNIIHFLYNLEESVLSNGLMQTSITDIKIYKL